MILFHLLDNSRVNPSILCADPDRLVRGGGSIFDFSFKVTIVETREDRNTTVSGPSSARQRSAIYMAFAGVPMMAHIWRFAGVPMMVQHLRQ